MSFDFPVPLVRHILVVILLWIVESKILFN